MTRGSLRTFALLLCVAAFLATQPGAGCVSDTSSGGPTSGTPVDNSTTTEIPRRAAIVKEGKGPIDYTADADGDLYVQDLKAETTVVTHRIHRGENVRVVPAENSVMLDNDSIFKGDLKKDHAHRIYVLRDRRFDDTVARRDSNGVPRDATLIGEGADREITFKANHDGRAYLLESDTRKIVGTVDLKDGERFTFSPGSNRVTVDGKRVIGRDFDTRMKYRVYFDK